LFFTSGLIPPVALIYSSNVRSFITVPKFPVIVSPLAAKRFNKRISPLVQAKPVTTRTSFDSYLSRSNLGTPSTFKTSSSVTFFYCTSSIATDFAALDYLSNFASIHERLTHECNLQQFSLIVFYGQIFAVKPCSFNWRETNVALQSLFDCVA
jgi:hypothetical protein